MNLSLIQRDIFHQLESDVDFFGNALTAVAVDLAASYGCSVDISNARLREVQDYWLGDIRRVKEHGFKQQERNTLEDYYDTPIELDHFKRAAFLCFWMRRLTPIIAINGSGGSSEKELRNRGRFFAFANEIWGYTVALQLCGFHEWQKYLALDSGKLPVAPSDLISRRTRDWLSIRDYVMVLRHKNVSPHALYLVFRSLFLH